MPFPRVGGYFRPDVHELAGKEVGGREYQIGT
jgi:hypothetical protein